MTNKQTIDGVPRELAERVEDLLACPQHHVRAEYVTAYTELRAILENTALESQYDGMSQAQAQAVSDGVDEILHGNPVAHPQGEVEPLAILLRQTQIKHSKERDTLRTQLAERDALLRESYSELLAIKAEIGFRGATIALIGRIDAALSTSAEPKP